MWRMDFGQISNIVHSGMEALQKNSFRTKEFSENLKQESIAEIAMQP